MQHCTTFLVLLVLFFVSSLTAKPEKLDLTIQAEAAILINADTGAILYEKNPHALHYPASITKVVTAICALEKVADKMDVMIAADQDCIGTVTEEAFRRSNYTLPAYFLVPGGCHIGIKRGEELSLKDLFNGMLIASADDAANIIAKYAGGTIPQFIAEMNHFAERVGCRSTTFYNPHGLHHPKQQTTAYDMALITKEALKNPTFREFVRTPQCTRPKTNKQEPTTLVQTNKLLRRSGRYFYSKAIGVKTGYYSLARHNLIAAAKDGDRTLIAVLLKTDDRNEMFLDAKKMFETAFSQPKVQRVLLHKGPQKFTLDLPGRNRKVASYIAEDVSLEYYPAEEPALKFQIAWNKTINLPIAKDQPIGNFLVLSDKGEVLRMVPLLAQEKATASLWENFKQSLNTNSVIAKGVVIIVVGLLVTFIFLELRRRRS